MIVLTLLVTMVFVKQPGNLPYARALVVALRDIETGEELFGGAGRCTGTGHL